MAATGTPTPNIGLRRAQGTDPASVDDINYNSELLDTKLGAVGNTSVQEQINALSASTAQTFGNVQDGLAIVSNGNTHVAIPAGYWVYVKGHGTLSEGLYKNTSGATIAANATLSTSNLTADPDGGLNSVYDALNHQIKKASDWTRKVQDAGNVGTDWTYTGISFSITAFSGVKVEQMYNNAAPQGIIISRSNSSTEVEAVIESSVGSLSLHAILKPGTYYVWGKANNNNVLNTFLVDTVELIPTT